MDQYKIKIITGIQDDPVASGIIESDSPLVMEFLERAFNEAGFAMETAAAHGLLRCHIEEVETVEIRDGLGGLITRVPTE